MRDGDERVTETEGTEHLGSGRDEACDAHPTISSMADTVQAEHAVRWLFFGGWVALGWSLAT